jgi:hypothetical protein
MGTIDPAYYTVADGDGHTKAARDAAVNVGGDPRPVTERRASLLHAIETTLEANAALRSIVRRDTGASYQDFLTKLAQASGIETPTRADLARERLERPFAHLYETGGMRRVYLRGHSNILKRLLIHTGGFNLGLLMRQLIGVGTPRGLQGRLTAVVATLVVLARALGERVTRHRPAIRHISPLEHRSITPSAIVHIGVRRMVFTTGC